MTDQELAQALTGALDARIARAEAAPVSIAGEDRMPPKELIAATVIKAVPAKQAHWKNAAAAVLALAMLGGATLLAFKFAGRTEPDTPGNSDSNPSIVQTTEQPVTAELPTVEFDEETKTLRIVGTGGYDQLDLPQAEEANTVEVEDDDYRLTLSVAVLRNALAELDDTTPVSEYLPGYLGRLDKSTSYIRQFIAQNAPNEQSVAQTKKPVSITVASGAYCYNKPDQIQLSLGQAFRQHGIRYALCLMDPQKTAWQHLGFSSWVGLTDPNCSLYAGVAEDANDADNYYSAAYYRVGGTGKLAEPKEALLLNDANAWYNLVYGRDWPGTATERGTISELLGFNGDPQGEGNDMSLSMAVSLINYLAEQYGADKVTAYCFDTCTFEEAFGVDYATARAAWEQSLLDRFGDGSETKPAASALPTVEFDEETKTLHIVGTGNYDSVDLSRLQEAKTLLVEDDDFTLTAQASLLSSINSPFTTDVTGYLPLYLNDVDHCIPFVRQYVADHSTNEEVLAQTRKPVEIVIKTMNNYVDFTNSPDQIRLYPGGFCMWFNHLYTQALINPAAAEWQHLGYSEWMSFIVDPYDFSFLSGEFTPNKDYHYVYDYLRVGGSDKTLDGALMADACSWYNMVYGMDWNGSIGECHPLTECFGCSGSFGFTGNPENDGNDMSLLMATSLINYLAEQYGTDKVTAYCFDTCTFEEAFGVDYATARAVWEQSLMERFGDGSETKPAASALPTVEFDEETKTLRVVGSGNYDKIDLSRLPDATSLIVEDDDFEYRIQTSILSSSESRMEDPISYLPGYLELVDQSLATIRKFVADNAPNEDVIVQTQKRVKLSLNTFRYYNILNGSTIDLELGDAYRQPGMLYTMALLNPSTAEWKHLAYGSWVENAKNPYSPEYFENPEVDANIDYLPYSYYFQAGGSGDWQDVNTRILLDDIISWCNLVFGRDWGGNVSESGKLSDILPLLDASKEENRLSEREASSLLNYLAEQYGADKVTAYCFDACSFEEAFGTDFAAARAAWEQSLMERFGDGSDRR